MSDLQTVQDDLTTASATLDDLRSALRDGADVDLANFNRMVAETCSAAVSLPKADAPKVRRQLEKLLGELNAARDEIAAEQARIAEALGNGVHADGDADGDEPAIDAND